MINLKPKHAEILRKIFESYCPKAEIRAYGSRVNGDSHEGSDLDLTVVSFNEPNKNLNELKRLINESNIPFSVDISEFRGLPESFRKEIQKKKVIL